MSLRHHKTALKPLCSYSRRQCTRDRLGTYRFCITHILEDQSAPFQQCTYTLKDKRCRNAAPRTRKSFCYCPYHVHLFKKQPIALNSKTSHGNNVPKSLLQQRNRQLPIANGNIPAHDETSVTMESEHLISDNLKIQFDDVWLEQSDESDSELEECSEDPLKHAGVYTYEEVASMFRGKLRRLQSLYIEQFQYLFHVLKEKRRKYLRAKEEEKKRYCHVTTVPRLTAEEETQYQILKSMYRYRHHFGNEAVLYHKYMQKRTASIRDENIPPPREFEQCAFMQGKQGCSKKVATLSNYCFDHILLDPHQVLFKKCSGGNGNCSRPVVPVSKENTCFLHSHVAIHEADVNPCKMSPNTYLHVAKKPMSLPSPSPLLHDLEPLPSMDDIASLGLDAIIPPSLFNFTQFGEMDEKFEDSIISSL